MCAATQLDSGLAERMVNEILDQGFKAVPWSPGVHLGLVMRYALLARRRQLMRDCALSGLLLAAFFALIIGSGVGVLVLLLSTWLTMIVERLVATYGVMARHLSPGSTDAVGYAPRFGPQIEERLAGITTAGLGNVIVYGSYSPFIGSGFPLDAWSFALDIDRPVEGRSVEKFTALDIHRHTEDGLRRLQLGGLAVTNRVFVDGRDVRGDRRFLTTELSRPMSRVDDDLLCSLTADPEDRARPYLCLRVEGWRGQLVLSTFLRFVITGNKLFVELSHSLLTPVLDKYQAVDRLLPQPTGRQLVGIMGERLRALPRALLRAPSAVLDATLSPVAGEVRRSRQRQEITSGLRFNYGATTSPREEVADPLYQRYFQQLDKELFEKVVERHLLDSITNFLDDRGVDTGELRERRTTIMNNGVYISGGEVSVESMAVGKRAKASATTSAPRTSSKAK
jgi:hypothetical protein